VALLMIALLDQLLAWGGLRAPGVRELRWVTFWTLGMLPAVLVAGLLEARLARSAVGDALTGLWDGFSPVALRDALARLLHDPQLRLLYWLPVQQRWSTADGEPEDLPHDGDARVATVIDQDGRPLAALVHDTSLTEEPELLDAVAAATGLALENGRLRAELLARVQELTESRLRVLEAARRERQRLERDLHDGAQQRLVTLSLELGLLQAQLTDRSDSRRSVEQVRREIALALDELRRVARGIYPAVLSAHGLQVALESLTATAPVPVRLTVGLREERLPEAVEMAVYFLARQSIADVARHADVTDVALDVESRNGVVTVEIEADGAVPPADTADPEGGPGRRALTDRIEALGGRLRRGVGPDGGTAVRAEIPAGSGR
jgi:signal transduction histidine kinase